MIRILHAWLEGRHAGVFTRTPAGSIDFEYADSAPITPLSLSLPRGGGATRRAAANFLDNLLPDNIAARQQMASAYGSESVDIFDLLARAGGDVASADAHAKNYSLLLRPDDITLSPMYDVVPVGLYPQFDQRLAMRVGGARRAREVTPAHWRKLARTSGLSEDRVTDTVTTLARSLREAVDTIVSTVPEVDRTRALVIENTEPLLISE